MLKKAAAVLGLVLLVLIIVVATRPDSYRVERSAQIAAPPAVVYGFVADFHKWDAWSPWERLDPGMKKTYEGPVAGVGSVYTWSGNDQVGEGRMTLTEAQPGEKLGIKLEFLRPWKSTSTTTFTFAPSGDGTRVAWAMEGHNDFLTKGFTLFMDMEKMISQDFDKGLAAMKGLAEAEARKLADAAKAAAQAAAAQAAAAQPAPAAPAPAVGK